MKKIYRVLTIAGVVAVAAAALVLMIRRPAGDGSAPAATTATAASALTVELVAPDTRIWSQTLRASGTVAAWEEVVISPETGGLRIAELAVAVGQRVAKGQPLVRLADDTVRAELAKQEALVAQAEASLQQAAGNLKRAQAVDLAGAIAPQKLDEYRANEATARELLLRTRFTPARNKDGRIVKAQVRVALEYDTRTLSR